MVMTFKRVPKKFVTGATKVKARVVSEEAEEEDSQEPKIRRGSRKPPGTYSQEQSLPVEGFLGTYLGKTAPENPPIALNRDFLRILFLLIPMKIWLKNWMNSFSP
jgi:hypothetical protein